MPCKWLAAHGKFKFYFLELSGLIFFSNMFRPWLVNSEDSALAVFQICSVFVIQSSLYGRQCHSSSSCIISFTLNNSLEVGAHIILTVKTARKVSTYMAHDHSA